MPIAVVFLKEITAPGSEHTVNGRCFDGEIHFVLFNSKYGTLENAENKPDGVAVLAFFVTWSELQALESTGDFDARYGNYRVSQPLDDRIVESNFLPPGNTRNRRRHSLSHTLKGRGTRGTPCTKGLAGGMDRRNFYSRSMNCTIYRQKLNYLIYLK
ncbi:uncharacterized protein LOC127863706 [Dreissena polymorpha]|uniref:uncharacterized protein LOC127863706 n=1 Tax=Dreissena polymorpha TaxID=45954 RepID=UPI0022650135|nr:uncharacterized protein LOC127863706 [Dreissena polymorpha]